MPTLNKVMAARYQQENHVTRYPVILYRSVVRAGGFLCVSDPRFIQFVLGSCVVNEVSDRVHRFMFGN